jgi:hypothetical protein
MKFEDMKEKKNVLIIILLTMTCLHNNDGDCQLLIVAIDIILDLTNINILQ